MWIIIISADLVYRTTACASGKCMNGQVYVNGQCLNRVPIGSFCQRTEQCLGGSTCTSWSGSSGLRGCVQHEMMSPGYVYDAGQLRATDDIVDGASDFGLYCIFCGVMKIRQFVQLLWIGLLRHCASCLEAGEEIIEQ
ncbi:hypothetical protein ANCCEY_06010 [Ancylostoma ceylanicum]|uniref:EB domain-containing protein n=1 Tax=Ancylostoma ceylanicum TaxID=53326 RepID=A0A0D6LSQ6_9BILA|nr:hypothetical protein ANCCEY_06010 [Ancylostoma ceylanicum]